MPKYTCQATASQFTEKIQSYLRTLLGSSNQSTVTDIPTLDLPGERFLWDGRRLFLVDEEQDMEDYPLISLGDHIVQVNGFTEIWDQEGFNEHFKPV